MAIRQPYIIRCEVATLDRAVSRRLCMNWTNYDESMLGEYQCELSKIGLCMRVNQA